MGNAMDFWQRRHKRDLDPAPREVHEGLPYTSLENKHGKNERHPEAPTLADALDFAKDNGLDPKDVVLTPSGLRWTTRETWADIDRRRYGAMRGWAEHVAKVKANYEEMYDKDGVIKDEYKPEEWEGPPPTEQP